MQDAIRAILDKYALVTALAAVPVYRDVAPAGVAFPYCIYSCSANGAVDTMYGRASLLSPFAIQFSFFATGRNATKGMQADDLSDSLYVALSQVVALTLATGHAATLRPTFKRAAVFDRYIADPAGGGSNVAVYHALTQYEVFYTQTNP